MAEFAYKPTLLVIGGAGYIGSTVVFQALTQTNYNVVVLDKLMYGGESLFKFFNLQDRFKFFFGDVRTYDLDKLMQDHNVDFCVNVAALVGEHICKKFPKDALEINEIASMDVAKACDRNHVKRYIFASTCSNYGKTDIYVDEEAQVAALSLYAKTKIAVEGFLKTAKWPNGLQTSTFRFATVYGLASRVRFDLLIHEFIRDAWVDKKISIFGPEGWRPFIHVDDAARACMTAFVQHDNMPERGVFNIGSNDQNFQKRVLGEMIVKRYPAAVVDLVYKKADPRSYRVNFSKFSKLTGFQCRHRPEAAINDIISNLECGLITLKQLNESVNITANDPIRKLESTTHIDAKL
jgi:nucleoside-diphosphate-sugar epimerase